MADVPVVTLLLTVIIMVLISQSESITIADKTKIDKGLTAGHEIFNYIADKKFSESLTKISSAIGPFLGAFGPFVSLVLTFVPSSDTAVVQLLTGMMDRIENRFDQVDSRFDEIKRLVEWTDEAVNFGQIEQKIWAMNVAYRRLYRGNGTGEAANRKQAYIDEFDNNYQQSGINLYHAIVNKHGTFQENLGESIMRFTDYDRKKTQDFLLGILRLILNAAKIEIAYYNVKQFNSIAEERKSEWETKIQRVKSEFEHIDKTVIHQCHSQSKKDIKKISADNYKMGNEQFSSKLYDMLTEKYYWRNWLVVVYDEVRGFDKHTVSQCGGYIKFRKDGRNLVVASLDKNQDVQQMSRQSARTKLIKNGKYAKELVKVMVLPAGYPKPKIPYARILYKKIDTKSACSTISIISSANVWHRGPVSKLVFRQYYGNLQAILFGNFNTSKITPSSNWMSMSRQDIKDLASDYDRISNKYFSSRLYDMLKERYYWRDWFVVVYDDIKGFSKHTVRKCGGHILFRQNRRNIMVSSIDKNKSVGTRTLQSAKSSLKNIPWKGTGDTFAKRMYNKIDKTEACGVVSVLTNAHVSYRGDKDKIAYRNLKGHLHMILFGKFKN
ncbi:unnamed protein product [Owenia fusiformis]|uniref:Uncharacterized protein n=1 Tax=Owenia fusiformis TaxID=6347 RepID=A0A8J1UWB9_OWEFU|nr:unnamed protein product [Owenia fusiformis]